MCDRLRLIIQTNLIETAVDQIFIDIRREESVISLKDRYLKLNFHVVQAADETLNGVGNDIKFVNSDPIALLSGPKTTCSFGRPLEYIDQSHVLWLS